MATARPDREQIQAIFTAKLLDVITRKILKATSPDQARHVAAEMFAMIEAHGWRFITRGEQEAAEGRGATASEHVDMASPEQMADFFTRFDELCDMFNRSLCRLATNGPLNDLQKSDWEFTSLHLAELRRLFQEEAAARQEDHQ